MNKNSNFIWQAFPLFLVGLTLRPLTTAIGPILPEIRAEFGLSATSAAVLSTLPVIAFGAGAFFVPRVLHRITPNHALSFSLLIIALGAHLRMIPTVFALFLGTLIIGLGVALGNVIPSVIARRDFPKNLGGVMGMVIGAISLAPAISAQITFPLTQSFNSWRWALYVWALLPVFVWFSWRGYSKKHSSNAVLDSPHGLKNLLKNPLAWSLVLYFGFQSTNYYSLGSWYPTILREAGISPTIAGYQLALMVMTGFPAGLIIPPLATKYKSQVGLCVGSVAFFAAGLIGIYIFSTTGWWPDGTWLWSTLLGIGLSTSFPLALTLVLLRTEDQETARDVSSFMQGMGYFISAIGPIVLGAIRDTTNSWNMAYAALGIALLIQLIAGVIVSRPVTIKTN
ncbi:MAG: hypothetical protein RL355_822 [Actinomycetota bacterium]